MFSKVISPWVAFTLVTLIGAASSSCATAPPAPPLEAKTATPERQAEVVPTTSPISVPSLPVTTEQVAAKEPAKLPPPKPEEIKGAIARIFEKAATADTSGPKQSFLVGDFNGDGSEDLAVVVTPSESGLGDINSEVANWTLEDPANVAFPGATARPAVVGKRVQAEKGRTLLAIIHGVGQNGWRDANAKQSYLLKNGAGTDLILQPVKQLRNARDRRPLPPLQGDAIQETIAGKPGLVFWTGAKYAWYIRQSRPEAELH